MSSGGNSRKAFWSMLIDGAGTYLSVRLVMITIGVLVAIVCITLMVLQAVLVPPQYTQTTDLADYGNYIGTRNDNVTQGMIQSFFPGEIEPFFSDVIFSYKAENIDAYGFEAYLEFRIEDEQEFCRYIEGIEKGRTWNQFLFDDSFMVCSLINELDLQTDKYSDPTGPIDYQIGLARIRQILYSVDSKTVIYVAMGVYDGGGVGTNYLNTYFDRFDIDPLEYEKFADSPYE